MSLAGLDEWMPKKKIKKIPQIEDPFTKEERWIMSGGDTLYSEFESKTPFPTYEVEDQSVGILKAFDAMGSTTIGVSLCLSVIGSLLFGSTGFIFGWIIPMVISLTGYFLLQLRE